MPSVGRPEDGGTEPADEPDTGGFAGGPSPWAAAEFGVIS